MPKNIELPERIVRIVLGVVGILLGLATGWAVWVRVVIGLVGVAFLATAVGGY